MTGTDVLSSSGWTRRTSARCRPTCRCRTTTARRITCRDCGCRRWRCRRRRAGRSTWRRRPGAEQAAFAAREHIPFPLLSDPGLALAAALRLPTFEVAGMRLYKRIALVAEDGAIAKVFYPVFPPDRNAADVAAWLRDRR